MVSKDKYKDAVKQIKGCMLDSYEEACKKRLLFYDNVAIEGAYKGRADAYREMYVMICEKLSDKAINGDEDE